MSENANKCPFCDAFADIDKKNIVLSLILFSLQRKAMNDKRHFLDTETERVHY